MRTSRLVMIAWAVLIGLLLIVELAEITHLFTLPVESAVGDPLVFVLALVFTTIVALSGRSSSGSTSRPASSLRPGSPRSKKRCSGCGPTLPDVKAAVEELRRGPGSPAPPRSGDEEDDP